MSTYIKTIIQAPLQILFVTGQASKTVLANKNYRLALFILIPLVFFLVVSIPVNTIPSNDFKTQLSLYKSRDYPLLTTVSFLVSLFLLMHMYNFKRMRHAQEKTRVLGTGAIGSSAGALASVFGAATCPMCVASLFGFLGFGAVGFLVQYQWWVFAIALFLMLASLYFVSRRVNNTCEKCI